MAKRVGQDGLKFVRRGDHLLAENCTNTRSGVAADYATFSRELHFVAARVKAEKGNLSGEQLRKEFKGSPLTKAADQSDWDSWASGTTCFPHGVGGMRFAAV